MEIVVLGGVYHQNIFKEAIKWQRLVEYKNAKYRNKWEDSLVKDKRHLMVVLADAPEKYESHMGKLINVSDVKVVNPALYRIHHFELFNFDHLLLSCEDWRNSLDYVEFHVTDQCNLNCKGCSHFCNLVNGVHNTDYEQWRKDLFQLRKLVKNIQTIRILGGEPFLNPELDKYVVYTRELFPASDIHVVSNSLLLDKVNDKIFDAIRDQRVIVDISHYPLLDRDRVMNFLETKKVLYRMGQDKVVQFSKNIDLKGGSDPREAYDVCINHGCHFMYNGRICTCALPLLSHYFNSEYGAGILPESDDSIDLYDSSLEFGSLRKLLDRPIEPCRFCANKWEYYEWKGYHNKPEISDWVIGM